MPNVIPLRPDEPRRIGRYRLTGRIEDLAAAPGAPGRYAASRADGETVTVTLLGPGRAGDAAARDRFTAEARVARRVPPFCAARILDAGFEGNRPYLVAEFVRGPTLAEAVLAGGPLPEDAVRGVAAGAATGLAAVHQAGLVHGSLGPDKVVLSPDGPRVIDFSITPPYGAATPASDMLAWARTVLFAAAGPPPAQSAHRHAGSPGAPGSPPALTSPAFGQRELITLPGDLRTVVASCLSPDLAQRPTARAVLTELLSGRGLSAGLLAEGSRLAQAAARAPAAVTSAPARAPRRRRPVFLLWLAACGLCVLAIVAAVAVLTRGHPRVSSTPAASGHTVEDHVPAGMTGSWAGTVRQTNPPLAVTVHLVLGSRSGRVAYPALGCSGSLSVVAASPARVVVRQTIGTGRTSCEDGLITLTRQASGKLGFTFARRGGARPAGTLTRQPPP
jgi:hypothetical protein